MLNKNKRGLTLMEIVLALSIAIFVFQLVFYVYLSLFRSWDFGFLRGQSEDEARRAVVKISRELRSAYPNTLLNGRGIIRYNSPARKTMYFYSPQSNYNDLLTENFVTSNYSLKVMDGDLDANNYGAGQIIGKEFLILTGAGSGFVKNGGLIQVYINSNIQGSGISLNTAVYPRSKL